MEEFDQKWRDMTKLGEFELIMAEFVQKKGTINGRFEPSFSVKGHLDHD